LRFSTNVLKYRWGAKLITINKGESEKMVKKVLLVIALIVMVFSSVGCQTAQGLGEDIKWTGEKGAEILEQ
jgi:predicted small secreted protein